MKINLYRVGKAVLWGAIIASVAFSFSFGPNTGAPNITSIVQTAQAATMNVWWPTDGAKVSGVQPFKVQLMNQSVNNYNMYWQVDGGQMNAMYNSSQDYPHKEAMVDLNGWSWHGSGPYIITFTAKDFSGNTIGQIDESIYLNGTAPAPITVAPPAPPQTDPAPTPTPTPTPTPVVQDHVNVWWPTDGATVSGNQPFQALLAQTPVENYTMYWQVDNGGLNEMPTNYTNYPHKQEMVDLSGWHWDGAGPYHITFVAKNTNGQEIARTTVAVTIPQPANTGTPTPPPVSTESTSTPPQTSGDIFSGAKLYVNPSSDAAKAETALKNWDPTDATLMDKIARNPEVEWFGDWNTNVQNDVNNVVTTITQSGALPVLVAYDIPNRDCGGWSSGGAGTASAYTQWIQNFAAGIGHRKAAVILEPDATSLTSCLSSSDLQTRDSLLSNAVSLLKANGQAVYIDAGHADWISASDMANRLQQAGIAKADGFALNISNFYTTQDNEAYGQSISNLLGGKHFVIDTSRNGNGPTGDAQWCNPSGRALGIAPTANTGDSTVDAFLWVKGPGSSDGACNGAPPAGVFSNSLALELARNAHW